MCPILDIHPGYLGSQELIKEVELLHCLLGGAPFSKGGKAGSNCQRMWAQHKRGAYVRYLWLLAELKFRSVKPEFPEPSFLEIGQQPTWPESVNSPAQQFSFLEKDARIPLPKNHQQLWAQHKYSILARDVNLYRELGPKVAAMKTGTDFSMLANQLTLALRIQPEPGGMRNALQHMWGYVSEGINSQSGISGWDLKKLNQEIQTRVASIGEMYLLHSTALTELETWLPNS